MNATGMRRLLALFCALGPTASCNCDPTPIPVVPCVVPDSGPPDARPLVSPENPDAAPYDSFASMRRGCAFGKGQTTVDTIGPKVRHGDALPFQHVLVLMMENRSFDHYFSKLNASYPDADVATALNTSINPSPKPSHPMDQPPFHETRYCVESPDHEWTNSHLQYDNGKMDGFIATNWPDGEWAMGEYDESDIPYYYWLAKTFATSDRHFSSVLGPTWPNRFFFFGATSWGRTFTPATDDARKLDVPSTGQTIFTLLDAKSVSWRIYYASSWPPLTLPMLGQGSIPGNAISPISDLESDVLADALPSFAFIEPNFRGDGSNDEHPPSNVQMGQAFVQLVVNALASNPKVWAKTVLFITHDEHGGFYDHVPPPEACEPDNIKPNDFAFDRNGFRVPLLVVSPFARRHYMSHYITDHTSITRFIENRFDLPAMTSRDANAWPLLDLFDFDSTSVDFPAGDAGELSPAGLAQCGQVEKSHRRGFPPEVSP